MYRVRVVGTGWTGGPSLNTFYFTSGSYDAAGALDVATHVRAVWDSNLKNIFPTKMTHNVQSEVDQIDPANGDVVNTFSITAPAGVVGVAVNALAPTEAAALLRLTTGLFLSGRRLRGRVFLSPISSDRVDGNGELTSAARAYTDAFFSVLSGALTSGDAWVVWHRPVGGSGGQAAAITGAVTNVKLASLRSRRD